MLTCGVEVSDPRIFGGRGNIIARCEPGVCRFYLDGAVAVIRSEAVRGKFQEEIKTVRRDSCGEVLASRHFVVKRQPGVIVFTGDPSRDGLIAGSGLFGEVKLLPSRLAGRLDAMAPEEARRLAEWLAAHMLAACRDMVVLGEYLSFPEEERGELHRLLSRAGAALGAASSRCDEESGICDPKARRCVIEERREGGRVRLAAYSPDQGYICSLVLRF